MTDDYKPNAQTIHEIKQEHLSGMQRDSLNCHDKFFIAKKS